MKFTIAVLALTSTSAINLKYVAPVNGHSHGIPYSATMQEQPSHWRKVWPEGATDNGDSDSEVIVPAGAYYAEDVQLSATGIPYPAMMQEQPSHWRKVWPEGATDNSDGDAEILDRFNKEPFVPKKNDEEKYPWTLEDSIVASQKSVAQAEKVTGETLGDMTAARGLDLIHTYDNTKVQFERNLPYGPLPDWKA
tara:strand:- start:46 stop:627 length:582 start_codon:yes stop_codon:yes gene_type:complete